MFTTIKHGHCPYRKPSPTYRSWYAMKTRCVNPNALRYKDYGGRGILLCRDWLIFENFLADMGARPAGKTLDRIDNNGNYEPGNCRWATHGQQARKTRSTKLSSLDVILMRQMWIRAADRSGQKSGIANAFGVRIDTCRAVASKRSGANAIDTLILELSGE